MCKRLKIQFFSFLTLLAFVIGAALPFFAVYSPAEAAMAASHEGSGRILICSGAGFKWVNVNDVEEEPLPPSQGHHSFECALCVVSAHGLKAPLPDTPVFVQIENNFIATNTVISHKTLGDQSLVTLALIRAPPHNS